jgi:hypothetical protein
VVAIVVPRYKGLQSSEKVGQVQVATTANFVGNVLKPAAADLIWGFDHSAPLLRQRQLAIIISDNQAEVRKPRPNRPRDYGSLRSGRDLTKRHPFLADESVL